MNRPSNPSTTTAMEMERMSRKTLKELQAEHDEAAAAYGRGFHEWEMGRLTRQDLGTLKRRMDRRQLAYRAALYTEESGGCSDPMTFCACEHDCTLDAPKYYGAPK